MRKAERIDRAMRRVNIAGRAADMAWDALCKLEAQGLFHAQEKSRKFERLTNFYFELLDDLKEEKCFLEETPPPKPKAETSVAA
jgi:hypothetical protein